METRAFFTVDALIILVFVWFFQYNCSFNTVLFEPNDGTNQYHITNNRSNSLSCETINNIPDDPPERHYPTSDTPISLKGETGTAGTSLPSVSPSPEAV